jgi:iron complex transport system substrate-binding protein
VRSAFYALVLAIALTGCANTADSSKDKSGELRIIAAAAGSAEMLQEIGLAPAVIGVDERNSAVSKSPVVTNGHSFNFERLISLNPTHVVLDTLTDSSEVRDRLRASAITVIELPTATSIDEIFLKYKVLGAAFDKQSAAESASNQLKAKFADIEITTRKFRIAFLYLRGTNAIYFVGGKGSGADSLISTIGSIDVGAQQLKNAFSPLTAEVMRQLNPEVLLLMTEGYESVGGLPGLQRLPGLANTSAVKSGSIVVIDDRALLDFGPQTISVLQEIQKQLQALDAA